MSAVSLMKSIPFATRAVAEAGHEVPIIAREILDIAAAATPEIRTSRMIAKKGVRSWGEIGEAEILPFSERVRHTTYVVDRFMNSQWLDDLTQAVRTNLGGKKKVSLVFTRAYEDGSLNLIPPAMAAKLRSHLVNALPEVEVSINDTIFQASKANRTGASNAATLLARQQIFEGDVAKDSAHILLDEHIEAGATLRGLEDYIRQRGGHVAAIAPLTKGPGGEHLHVLPETLTAIEHALNAATQEAAGAVGPATGKILAHRASAPHALLDKTLAQLGLKRETLTNTEGLAIVAHLSHDIAAFDQLLRHAGTNLEEFSQGGLNYISDLLDLSPKEKTVPALTAAIYQDIGTNYVYLGNKAALGR